MAERVCNVASYHGPFITKTVGSTLNIKTLMQYAEQIDVSLLFINGTENPEEAQFTCATPEAMVLSL